MLAIQRCSSLFKRPLIPLLQRGSHRFISAKANHQLPVETDSHGIPVRPTWSVNELLSSYPKPTITAATLEHLHELSALIPPEEGTPEHQKLTDEMENLIKLVEAVKLVDPELLPQTKDGEVPDGRIWAEGFGIELTREKSSGSPAAQGEVHGQALLDYAARTENNLYVVDADRSKRH